jgi:Tle cognate immunity protein 4 C-terminal domain/Tle cognate immunity protein 4 N-terminal domain
MTGFGSKTALVVAVTSVVALSGCNKAPSAQETKSMEQYTKSMKPHCFGRFLIDVPEQAGVPSGGRFEYAFGTVARAKIQGGIEVVDRHLAERERVLRTETRFYAKTPRFIRIDKLGPEVRSLLYFEEEGDGREIEGYIVKSEDVFLFDSRTYDDEDRKQFNDDIVALAPRIHSLGPGKIPTEPGFCFPGGYINADDKRGENASMGWSLKDRPEVSFGASTGTNLGKVKKGILERDLDAGYLEQLKGILTTVRKQRREINGMQAQEWLMKFDEPSKRLSYRFNLEIPGKAAGNNAPAIKMEMNVGGDQEKGFVPASLTEGEAIALWDAVTKTLRLRPGAF